MDLDELKAKLENSNEVVYPTGDYDKRERMAEPTYEAKESLPLHIVMRSIFNELQHDSRFVSRSVCFNDDYRKGYSEAVRNFKVIVKDETGIEL